MSEQYNDAVMRHANFTDRLTELLLRERTQPMAPGLVRDSDCVRQNDNALDYSSYSEDALKPLVYSGEVIGWPTSLGLFVPRRQFNRLGITLKPGVQDLWDTWAPSTHSKVADLRTPRPAILWAALSISRINTEINSPIDNGNIPPATTVLDFICEDNYSQDCLPSCIREEYRDVSRITTRIAHLVLSA